MVNLSFKEGFISVPGERREKRYQRRKAKKERLTAARKREDESTESSVQITKRRGEKVLDKHSSGEIA